jgi:putative spermidine/putrescine transport system substrate-binding protein
MSNSEQKEKAYDFINFLLSPEAATTYNQLNQLPPASSKATPADGLDHVIFSNEELERFAHIPDYDYVSKQVDAWVKRFEAEIVPLL